MTFAQPLWLWAFGLLPVLLVAFSWNETRRRKLLRTLIAARLQTRLAGTISVGKRRARFTLLLLSVAAVIVALARPQLGHTWQQSQRKGRDVLIAIDVSRSMLANDLAPSRLGRAKLAAQDLIGQLGGDRIGLIAFAGSAFLQAPLTADFGAVLTSLSEFDIELIPRGGTNIAEAIRVAVEAFGKGESDNRALIVFTDGEELDADGIRAAESNRQLMRIFAIGLGSPEGSLIPVPGGTGGTEFVRDPQGQFVKSRLDEARLQKIAEATGGFYIRLQSGPSEMTRVVSEGLQQMTEKEIDAKMSRQPIERYQWPLTVGILSLAAAMLLNDRRRTTRLAPSTRVVAATLLAFPVLSHGRSGAMAAYEQKDYKSATELFAKDASRRPELEALHFNLGSAAYKAGDYDRALEAFAKAVTSPEPRLRARAEYNLGNTLFQRGASQKDKEPKVREWKNALQHYDQALKVDPKNADAEHNRATVRKMLEELEKEQQQQQQQKKEDQKQKDEQKKDSKDQKQNGKNQKGEEEPGQDQQKKPEQGKEGKSDEGTGKDSPEHSGKPDPGKEGKPQQPKPGEAGQSEKASEPDKQQPGEPQSDPKEGDAPKPGDRKPSGEVKSGSGQTPGESTADAQEVADAEAAADGRMTEHQAKALLDSLKSDEQRMQMRRRERRGTAPATKDW